MTDHWTALKTAGEVPPPSPEVLAHANRQLRSAARRRRTVLRVLAPVVAAVSSTAVVVGAVAVIQTSSGPTATPGPAVPPSGIGSTPAPRGTPTDRVAASCVSGYTPAELKKRGFAFDGTVLKIVADPGGPMRGYLLTLQVHEWFKPIGGGDTVTVRTITPPEGSGYDVSVDFPDYTVGTRLLITGEPQWGGTNPLKDAYAWGCGFSRAYTPDDAATWRKLLSK
ncbi:MULTISPECIES: hypothetical protein [unclassified Kribbella]|uniref:hypothetical protein n=1 Tax=unclassified Kribbella TaxID=2644121 RepID=UPI00301AEFA9